MKLLRLHINTLSLLCFAVVSIFSLFSDAAPSRATYSARIYKPDGQPLEASNIAFRFTVMDTSATCSIYIEDYTAVNMTGSGGLVFFSLGSGSRSFPVSGTTDTFKTMFDNSTTSFTCQQAGFPYLPQPSDNRKIVMQFNDGAGWQTLPAMTINSVPFAMYAGKSSDSVALNGKTAAEFVQKATDIPTCATGTMLYFNNASFTCISIPSNAAGVSSVAVGGGALSLTGTASQPVISLAAVTLSNDGYLTSTDYAEFKSKLSASATQITDVLGYVPASSATVTTMNSNLTSLQASMVASFASIVSSQWVTSGSAIHYSAGNVGMGTTTPVTALDVSGGVRIGTENATCAVSYAGTLRYSAGLVEYCNGTIWSAFGVAGAGITSLNGSSSSTQFFNAGIDGTAVNISSLNGAHTFNIPLAASNSVTAGLLSNADYTTFTNKMDSTSAALVSALGYTPANSTVVDSYLSTVSSSVSVLTAATAASFSVITSSQWITSGTTISYDNGDVSAIGNMFVGNRLGIGTSAPATSLDVAGIIRSTRANFAKLSLYNTTSPQEWWMQNNSSKFAITDVTAGNIDRLTIDTTGNVGIGVGTATSRLQITPGTSSVAPIKFGTGTLTTTAQSGTIEYDGNDFYVTDYLGVRRAIATTNSPGALNNINTVSSTSGIVLWPASGNSVTVSSTVASTNSSTGALIVNGGAGISAALNVGGIISSSAIIKGTGFRANQGVPDAADSSTNGYAFGDDGDTGLFSPGSGGANGVLAFFSNNGERMRLTASGSLGIGTTNPASQLEVSGTTSSNGQFRISTSRNVSASSSLFMRFNDINGSAAYLGFGGTSNQFNIQNYKPGAVTVATNDVERMRIDANGNVGVGTTNPLGGFHVKTSPVWSANNYGPSVIIDGNRNNALALLDSTSGNPWAVANAGGVLSFSTMPELGNSVSAASVRMAISPSGNVGIGTTTPSAKLHLSAGTSSIASLKLTSGTLTTSPQSGTMEYDGFNFYLTDGTNTRRSIATGSSAGSIDNAANINSSGHITMTPTGSVIVSSTTVSTNSQTGALIVNGGLGVAGNINSSGSIITSQNIQGVSVTATAGMISPYIAGSIISGASLTLDSTTHTSKGSILLAPNGGNVGIGTSTPLKNLEIQASGSSSSTLRLSAAGNSSYYTDFINNVNGSNAFEIQQHGITILKSTLDGFAGITVGNGNASLLVSPLNSNSSFVGSVGIGTSAPAQLLDVQGSSGSDRGVQIKNTGAGRAVLMLDAGGTSSSDIRFYNQASQTAKISSNNSANGAALSFSNGSTELMQIAHSGNVGIGTSAPSNKLNVAGSVAVLQKAETAVPNFISLETETAGSFSSIAALGDESYNAANPAFYLMRTSAGTRSGHSWRMSQDTSYGLKFAYAPNASWGSHAYSEYLRISTTGNVGIGTSAPTSALHVIGNIRGSGNIGNLEGGVRGQQLEIGDNSLTTLRFDSNNYRIWNSSFGEIARFTASGNVGVGIVAATARLHLASGTSLANTAPLKFTSGTLLSSAQSGSMEYDGVNFYLTDGSNTRRSIATGSSTGSIDNARTVNNSSGNISLVPQVGGSVIISATTTSTNSQTGALVVNGGLGVAGNIYSSGTIITSSNIQGASITATSGVSTTVIQGVPYLALNPNGGNVGIGTSAPVAALDVVGQIRMGTNTTPPTDGGGYVYKQSAGTTLSGYQALIETGSAGSRATRLTVDYAGNVGIGTTAPATKLDVNAPDGSGATIRNAAESSDTLQLFNAGANTASRRAVIQGWRDTVGALPLTLNESGGNVGIGTTNPQGKLQVLTSSAINGAAGYNGQNFGIIVGRDDGYNAGDEGQGIVFTQQYANDGVDASHVRVGAVVGYKGQADGNFGGGLKFKVQPTGAVAMVDSMILTKDGNVGIGTASASAKLHISGGAAASLQVENSAGGIASVEFKTASGSMFVGATNGGDFAIRTSSDITNANQFKITRAGSVGIGTSTPLSNLHVSGTSSYNGILMSSGNYSAITAQGGSISGWPLFQLNNQALNGKAYNIEVGRHDSGSFGIHDNASNTTRLAISPTGNVGIGTTTPQAHLHVLSSSSGGTLATLSNSSAGGKAFALYSTGSANNEGSGKLLIRDQTAGQVRFTLDGSGNLGIGTVSPSYKLDVSGTIRGFGITDSSDVRLKKDIKPISSSLNKILEVSGVTYQWKDTSMPKKQIGFIAQELEKVFPELVETDNYGMKSVNYSHLVAPLVEAFKSLYSRLVGVERDVASLKAEKANQSEVEALKKENAIKTKELEEMKARLEKIEKLLNSKK